MAALIAVLLFVQQMFIPGTLTWLVPGDYDSTVLQVDGTNYEVAFGAGCEDFAPEMDVQVVIGSGSVASLSDADGNELCNVLIGAPVD
jgi:hypothetical protein